MSVKTYELRKIPDPAIRNEITKQLDFAADLFSESPKDKENLLRLLKKKTVYATGPQTYAKKIARETGAICYGAMTISGLVALLRKKKITRREFLKVAASATLGTIGGGLAGSRVKRRTGFGQFGILHAVILGKEIYIEKRDFEEKPLAPLHEAVHAIQYYRSLPREHIPGESEGLSTAIETLYALQTQNWKALRWRQADIQKPGYTVDYDSGFLLGHLAHALGQKKSDPKISWKFLVMIGKGASVKEAQEKVLGNK